MAVDLTIFTIFIFSTIFMIVIIYLHSFIHFFHTRNFFFTILQVSAKLFCMFLTKSVEMRHGNSNGHSCLVSDCVCFMP